MFTCNGRGTHLFGEPDHDAALVARRSLGGAARPGMFCAGEIGPVGGRNFLHGFTASVVLFDADGHGRSDHASWVRVARQGDATWARPIGPRAAGINVIRGLAMDAPAGGQLGPPGHGHGARAAGPRAVDPGHALRRRAPRTGPTATASSSRPATRRSSSTRCSTSPATASTLDDLTAVPPVGQRHARATPRCTTPRASRSPPARSGQGFANGVGMGIAERWLRARFGAELCDHHTFVICSDGDLEEGISHEAASLAGHLGLGRLVYVYDDNHITIDGPTELALTDDAAKRFEAYGWHVDDLGEVANDTDALEAALRAGDGRRGRARR